jgi:hypothetical protein
VTLAEPGVGDVFIQLDLFPCDALLPDGATTFMNVRVIVADGQVQLWRLTSAGPVVVFQRDLLGWSGSVRTAYTLSVEDGAIVAGKTGGCACGAALATADLYPGRRRINTVLT